jgi:hypothetical protein
VTFTVTVDDSTPGSVVEGTWVETSISNLTSSDIFVIVGTNSNGSYAMTNDNGTSAAPAASAVTISEGKITSDVADNLKWNISGNATNGYIFYPNGSTSTWLYCNTTASSKNNENMRVGTGDRKIYIMVGDNLVTKDNCVSRYVSIFTQEWRGYIDPSIAPTTIKFYKYVAPSHQTVTVSEVGYATYCSEYALDFGGTDITAYVGSLTGTALTFTPIAQVPANTGLLLVASGGATANVPVIASASAVENNCLVGVNKQTTLNSNDYILNVKNGAAGFYKAGEFTALGAHKAYIPAVVGGNVKSFAICLEDDPTSIQTIDNRQRTTDDAIYNLAGQRIQKLQKGINIVNGKKILK